MSLASAAIIVALSRLRTVTAWAVAAGSVALAVLLIQTPPLAQLVHVSPLHLDDWVLAAAGSAAAAAIALGGTAFARRA